MALRVKKITPNAIMPKRGSPLSAGVDLPAAYDAVVPAGGKALIKTDLAVATPTNCYARIAPRSGLALKKFIDVGAGVVDADYRGNVGVILFNHGPEDFPVARGDRIAQLILEMICLAPVVEVEELEETARGEGGFGSTGMQVDKPETDAEAGLTKRPREEANIKGDLLLLVSEAMKKTLISKEEGAKLKALAFTSDERLAGVLHAFQQNSDDSDLAENLKLVIA